MIEDDKSALEKSLDAMNKDDIPNNIIGEDTEEIEEDLSAPIRPVIDKPLDYSGEVVPNPLRAIRKHCVECSGGVIPEVKLCQITKCYCFPFRMGRNPYRITRKLTKEQKDRLATRLSKSRSKIVSEISTEV